jgi:hypothetical protein
MTECLKNLIEKMKEEIEEYGDLHGEECPINMEDPDDCNCEEMEKIKYFTEKWMNEVNKYWVEMAEAHRPYCRPEGNKMITRMVGKKNRNLNKYPLS